MTVGDIERTMQMKIIKWEYDIQRYSISMYLEGRK